MALIPTIEAIKKHGVLGVLVLVIFLMYSFFTKRFEVLESKLERVELKLYDCLEDRIQTSKRQLDKHIQFSELMVGILPDKKKYGTKRKMAI
jgi:uncharacterized membrane protein